MLLYIWHTQQCNIVSGSIFVGEIFGSGGILDFDFQD